MTDQPETTSSKHGLPRVVIAAAAGVAVVALVIGVLMWTSGDSESAPKGESSSEKQDPGPVDLKSLTESTTHESFDNAPADDKPDEPTDGKIVHPKSETAVHDAPDGKAFAKVGPEQIGDTWLPVIDRKDGWVQVLLPSKPNGSTGWLDSEDLDEVTTPYEIRVHLTSMTLELVKDGEVEGEWPIGKGKKDTPTPTGRTFLLGSFTDPDQDYSPIILPLGSHSPTLDSFGGGPGTVAIHTWPTTDVLGKASSDGCIRVPKEALDRLTEVPLGTMVMVDDE